MANLTIDNFLYFSGTYGCIQANDANHQIIIRGDRAGTASNYTNYYQYGGTIVAGLGHKFWTGGALVDQTLKFHIADDQVKTYIPSQFNDSLAFADKGYISWGGSPTRVIMTSCGTADVALGTDYFTDRLVIKASTGRVGIGNSCPQSPLDIYASGLGTTNSGTVLSLRGGNNSDTFGTNQILFNYGGGAGVNSYAHAIKSRHNSGAAATNGLDFFVWTPTDATCTAGTKNVMTLAGSGYVGIGTCTPTNVLHVNGGGLIRNGGTDTVGFRAMGLTVDIASCAYAGVDVQDTNRHMALTSNVDNRAITLTLRNLSRGRFWDIVNEGTGTDKLLFNTWCDTGSGYFNRVTIEGSTGNMGINTCTPGTYKLNVNGSFYSAGSSCEYKTSICNYNTDSCMFMKLKPVTYQYKDEYCHLGKELKSGTQIGLIAEDTAEVFPELAILKEEENEKVVRNVDYEKLTIILLSELQKLRQEVDDLKHK